MLSPVNSRLRDIPQSHRVSLQSFIAELKPLLYIVTLLLLTPQRAVTVADIIGITLAAVLLLCHHLLFIATVTIAITIATITIIIVTVITAKPLLLRTVTNYHRNTYVAAIRARFRLQYANTILTFLLLGNGAIRALVIVKYKSQSSLG